MLIEKVFGEGASRGIVKKLNKEISWYTVHHKGGEVPRLMCIQGDIRDGRVPVYRHPMDDEPVLQQFTQVVDMIRKRVMQVLEEECPGKEFHFNHVLIQKYRNGEDFIGEHADKTIDIEEGSVIVNYSLGMERVMTLRSKAKTGDCYEIEKIPLVNDSMYVLDVETKNKQWKHAIHRDKGEQGERISFTFRSIGTYWDTRSRRLVGRGAPKAYDPHSVDMEHEKKELLKKFSVENSKADFDWEELYGKGSPASFVDYAARYTL